MMENVNSEQTKQSERDVRIQKTHDLRSMGINPYAAKFDKQQSVQSLINEFGPQHIDMEKDEQWSSTLRDITEVIEQPKNHIKTAGRLTLYRSHGKLSFGKLLDETGEVQLMFHRDNCSLRTTSDTAPVTSLSWTDGQEISAYKLIEKYIDVGDFVWVEWEIFRTHKGELTIFVSTSMLLSKAIQPLGDKYHGIGDGQESAYRQRYLDMIFNKSTLERMKFRSHFIKTLREFYRENDFIELDCPVLTSAASGAAAKPFITHHNDFDMDFYLRICNETELKKATIGWLEKVFTIATNFRNEWSDPSHLQEFMMLEHQSVFKSFREDMTFTEEMFDYLFDKLQLERKITVKDKQWVAKEVDFTTPRPKIDYVEWVNNASGLDITTYGIDDADTLRTDIKAKWIEFEGMDQMGTMTLIDYLYKKVLRPTIAGPAFIYNYPSIIAPLARISDEDPHKCEKRQVVVNGREIINSYGELVDPLKQQENFDEQSKAEKDGDEEATSADDMYVQAMEYGMPIQAWFGMGIERMMAILMGQENLRDMVMFPLMKPENTDWTYQKGENSPSILEGTGGSNFQAITYPSLPNTSMLDSLAADYLTETLRHCQQVGGIMKYFAKKLGHEEQYRYAVWLLHDLDRDHIGKDPAAHLGEKFETILADNDLPTQLVEDIRTHYPEGTWLQPTTLVQQYLIAVDELSWLIHAYSLMRPEWLTWMKRSSLNKKIKDKKFAAGVDREHVRNCEKYLDVPLAEFAMQVVEAMQSL